MYCMKHVEHNDNLGMAMLIAESKSGTYEPVSAVGSKREAEEIARDDYRRGIADLERGGSPLCPAVYKVWSRTIAGCTASSTN